MSLTTLFDKSFLESLSIDEAVWFDHFYLANVCPLFFVETLADLSKSVRGDRTPEQEVGLIAARFPQMHGAPNVYHAELCIANLLGHVIPMSGQISIPGGRPVRTSNMYGFVFEQFDEADAFSRWSRNQFDEVERLFARSWRQALASLDLKEVAKTVADIGIDGKPCKSLEQAKLIADAIVNGQNNPIDRMKLAILFFNVPRQFHAPLLQRWSAAGYPALSSYAPYAAYVLTVEAFFQIAVAAHLISSERPSNRADILYLSYLPFCKMFVSSDKLHRRCAPHFLRPDQSFVWGPDLKDDLLKLNSHYSALPEEVKERGIMSFAGGPPTEGNFLTTTLWDKHLPNWRKRQETTAPSESHKDRQLVERLTEFGKAAALPPEKVDFTMNDPGSGLSIQRFVQRRRGSWWQVPKDLPTG